jgi:hypothetical protein
MYFTKGSSTGKEYYSQTFSNTLILNQNEVCLLSGKDLHTNAEPSISKDVGMIIKIKILFNIIMGQA